MWRFIRQFPRESATARSVHGELVDWGLQENLLAGIYDAHQTRLWQAGRGKGRRPKPLPRPGLPGHKAERLGSAVPLEEAKARLRARVAGRSGKVDRPSLRRQIGEEAG